MHSKVVQKHLSETIIDLLWNHADVLRRLYVWLNVFGYEKKQLLELIGMLSALSHSVGQKIEDNCTFKQNHYATFRACNQRSSV